jgi:hypothetical protein
MFQVDEKSIKITEGAQLPTGNTQKLHILYLQENISFFGHPDEKDSAAES